MPTTPVAYAPRPVDAVIAAARRRAIMASVGIVLPVAGAAILYGVLTALFGQQSPDLVSMLIWFAAFGAAIGVVSAFVNWLWFWRTTRRRIDPGLALQLSPLGIETETVRIPWADVRHLTAVATRLDGHLLRIERASGEPVELPFEGLGQRPGTLDAAVRAYSRGRHRIDLVAFGA